MELCPGFLGDIPPLHRIVGANDMAWDALSLAEELCHGEGKDLLLDLRSPWLANGACIKVDELFVKYNATVSRDSLHRICMTFEPRSLIGISGASGSGKTTLLYALFRVLDAHDGKILLNGIDTQKVGLSTLRNAMAMLPEEPLLFAGTLRYNLDPSGHYADGRLWYALARVHLDDVVQAWPQKLDQLIPSQRANLSRGQRILLSLARMIVQQPSVVLIDEATNLIAELCSAASGSTAAFWSPSATPAARRAPGRTESLRKAFPRSTIIATAQHLDTESFDQHFVLERGLVLEFV